MRVLIVEDDVRLARSYQRNLERAGHQVEVTHDAEGAYQRLHQDIPPIQVVILDVLLPGKSGIELCRTIRKEGITTPVLLLTALDQTEDKVEGLDAGADDYLTKPFPFDELLARLRALARRPHTYDAVATSTELQVGDLVIDLLRHEVYRGNRLITLTPREYTLLEYLTRNADRVLTRDQLSAHIWPDGTDAGSNVLDSYIHHLREKLEVDVNDRLIHTVRGIGYALRTPAQEARR